MTIADLKTDAELLRKLQQSAERALTAEELFEQRVSWCWAQCGDDVTKQQVRDALRKVYGL